jgi:hypothetical protein
MWILVFEIVFTAEVPNVLQLIAFFIGVTGGMLIAF